MFIFNVLFPKVTLIGAREIRCFSFIAIPLIAVEIIHTKRLLVGPNMNVSELELG